VLALAILTASFIGARGSTVKFINETSYTWETVSDVNSYMTNIPPHTVLTVEAPASGFFYFGPVGDGYTFQISTELREDGKFVVTMDQDECGSVIARDFFVPLCVP
jgi:hypothetical protein